MARYVVDSKDLQNVIGKAVSIIALGDKAESNSITLTFVAKGVRVSAINSVGAYEGNLAATVETPGKLKVHILPDQLLSYAKTNKSLTLEPGQQSLKVSAGKSFSAEIYYIGNNEPIELDKPENNADIESIAKQVSTMLGMVGGIRNRTDNQALAVMVEWGDGLIEMTIGDSHHAAVIDADMKGDSSGKLIMTVDNMSKIIDIGSHFHADDTRIIAWSDIEYLSIANQSESVFIADTARDAIKGSKPKTKFTVDTAKFGEMLATLVSAVDETSSINFNVNANRMLAIVKTGSSSAKYQLKVDKFKGKEVAISATIHHLKDCFSTMKEKETTFAVLDNMLALSSESKEITCTAAMAAVGVKV